jgi:uncharacterized membrane protein (UPF0127 family)
MLIVAIVLAACLPQGMSRWEVHIGDEPWTLLLQDRNGMRGKTSFDGADGMLIDYDQDIDPGAVDITMEGNIFPMDIAWFTDVGEYVGSASMTVCPTPPCPIYRAPGRFRWAIEAPVGAFTRVTADDRFDWHR